MPTVERVAGPRITVRDVGAFSRGDIATVDDATATYLIETVGGFEIATDETTDGYDGEESVCLLCGSTFVSFDDSPTCGLCSYEAEVTVEDEEPDHAETYHTRHGVEFEEARQVALERDGYECVECGMTDEEHLERDDLFGGGLHVHHLTPTADGGGNDLENLITLCAECHESTHLGDSEPQPESGTSPEAWHDWNEADWLELDYQQRAEDVHEGRVDDHLDDIEAAERSDTVLEVVEERRTELED